jgi:hypothetical protein
VTTFAFRAATPGLLVWSSWHEVQLSKFDRIGKRLYV